MLRKPTYARSLSTKFENKASEYQLEHPKGFPSLRKHTKTLKPSQNPLPRAINVQKRQETKLQNDTRKRKEPETKRISLDTIRRDKKTKKNPRRETGVTAQNNFKELRQT